eukprot:356659-Chlamydomonas_euryale.AAC.6
MTEACWYLVVSAWARVRVTGTQSNVGKPVWRTLYRGACVCRRHLDLHGCLREGRSSWGACEREQPRTGHEACWRGRQKAAA